MGSLVCIIRFAVRNMQRRRSRTLLTITGVVLGVAAVLATDITNESALAAIHRVFVETSGRAHLVIASDSAASDSVDWSTLHQVRKLPGVRQAAPSVFQKTLFAGDAERRGLIISAAGARNADDLLVFGVDPAIDQLVRDYEVVEGAFLGNDRDAHVALLVKDYADDQGLAVGDDLTILVAAGAESFRIVGLIRKTGPGLQNNGAVAILPIGAAQSVFDLGSDLSQLDVIVEADIAGSASRLEEFKSRLAEALGPGYQVHYPAARGAAVSKMLSTYELGLNLLGVTILFMGAFLIYNTFTMTVVERTHEIGMLRTLGMTRSQISLLVLIEALLIGCLGSTAGVGFGILLSRGLMHMTGGLTTTEVTQLTIALDSILISLLIGLWVTLASASLPAWRARDISPLETLRVRVEPQRIPLGRYGWLVGVLLIMAAYLGLHCTPRRSELLYPVAVTSALVVLLGGILIVPITMVGSDRLLRPVLTSVYGCEGRLGADNMQRAQGRSALTVAVLVVGIATTISIQTMGTSYAADIDNWVQAVFGGDLHVRTPHPVCAAAMFGDPHLRSPTRMREELGRRLLTESTVEAVTPITCHLVRRVPPRDSSDQADALVFIGIDPETYPQLASFVFDDSKTDLSTALATLAAGDALLISTTLADRYGVTAGYTLRLETRRGKRDFRVAGVVVDFARKGYVVIGTRADLKRYFGASSVHEFLVALKPGIDAQAESKRLEGRYSRSRQVVVETTIDWREEVYDAARQCAASFDVLMLVGVSIAALGIVNTLMMNAFERQREIGGLRSLGMTRGQVAQMVLAESGAMGVIGGLLGIAFGFYLSKIVFLASEAATGYRINFNMPPAALIVSLVIALLVSQGAALYPAWRAATVRIIEAIQGE